MTTFTLAALASIFSVMLMGASSLIAKGADGAGITGSPNLFHTGQPGLEGQEPKVVS